MFSIIILSIHFRLDQSFAEQIISHFTNACAPPVGEGVTRPQREYQAGLVLVPTDENQNQNHDKTRQDKINSDSETWVES
jgi:hypothetical protein